MAGTNTSEIRVAGVGRLYVAGPDTKVPTAFSADASADWTGWKDLGFTTGDGVTFSKKDKLEPIDVWQAVSPVHFVYSDRDLTLKFSLLQFNEDTLPFFMGGGAVDAVTAPPACTSTTSPSARSPMCARSVWSSPMSGPATAPP